MLDVVLEHATIVDGTGGPSFRTDVALSGDHIVRIGDCAGRDAAERVDCRTLVVAPRFMLLCNRIPGDPEFRRLALIQTQ